jgi:DNA-binding XRE family transcriptional regulator
VAKTGRLAQRLRRARDEAGLTQVELAEALGVSPSTVSRWENGKGAPHPWVVRRFMKPLGPEAASELATLAMQAMQDGNDPDLYKL